MSKWPLVPLREIMVQVSRPEAVDATATYRMLGARWYAFGLFIKDKLTGAEIQAAKVYRVVSGDFVYNRLFAWKGSFAVAGDEADGCFVSNEFPCFTVNKERVCPNFLKWYFSREAAWNEALGLSTGGTPTSRNRLKESVFLQMLIPLPSMAEQQKMVEYLDALSAKIVEAKRLVQETSEGFDKLCRSVLRDSNFGDPIPTPMSELVSLRSADVSVEADQVYQFAGVYCFGKGAFVGQHKSGMDFQYPRLTRLRTDDFVYPKLMAWEGALAVVPPECDGLVVSTEFPVFEIDQSKVLPEVLDVYFRTPSVWPALSGASTGTNVRRKRLNPADFLKYQIPLPSKESQQRLREIRSKLRGVTQGRVETIKELDAMLPAILHSVFHNGEEGEAV
jgi:type I restriction enzyme S subunit